jgi:hypothetical protein
MTINATATPGNPTPDEHGGKAMTVRLFRHRSSPGNPAVSAKNPELSHMITGT